MHLTQPFSHMFLDEVGRTGDVILLVGLQVPLDLSELALVEELMGKVLGLDLVVEFAVLLRRGEVQQVLADPIMNRMRFQQIQVGDPSAGFFGQDLTKVLEGV